MARKTKPETMLTANEVMKPKNRDVGMTAITMLKAYDKNAKKHTETQIEQVAKSIQAFGFVQPVVVDNKGTIVIGHCRVLAAQKLGMEKVPTVTLTDLDENEINALRLADNRLNESDWDMNLVNEEILALAEAGFDYSLTGFDLPDIIELDPEEDITPDIPEKAQSKLGDIYQLGEHRLIVGDSLSVTTLDDLMDGEKADLVWTDPPYNVAIEGKAGKIENDDMSGEEFYDFLLAAFGTIRVALREGGCIYISHADSERVNFTRAFVDAGFKLSQVLIWVKNSGTLSRQDYNWQHEPILYGWIEGTGHYFNGDFTQTTIIDHETPVEDMTKPQLVQLVNAYREWRPSTAIKHDRPTRSDEHPTMKPVGLVERMIKASSKRGEIVLDTFGGSGTTMIAADKLGRKCRMVELDPRFADVIVTRYCKHAKNAKIIRNGKSITWKMD